MKVKFAQRVENNQNVVSSSGQKGDIVYDERVRKEIVSKFDAAIALVRLLPDDAESS
jgi:hypothetical protein